MLCLHQAGRYSPAVHHVAGGAPPTMHSTALVLHVAGEYSPAPPSAFLLACGRVSSKPCLMWPGSSPQPRLVASAMDCKNHVFHAARNVIAMQPPASTATAAKTALGPHHRRRRGGTMDYDDGL